MDDVNKCSLDAQTQDQGHHQSLDMAQPGSVLFLRHRPCRPWHRSPLLTSTQLTASVNSIQKGVDAQRLALAV